jgi:hypothetical protein
MPSRPVRLLGVAGLPGIGVMLALLLCATTAEAAPGDGQGASSRAGAPAPGATGTVPSPPGAEKSARTEMLEAGAEALQSSGPPERLSLHLVGLHPMKAAPSHQVVAHHYCQQVNQEFAQCALYDGEGERARLVGIEYIISAAQFEQLPETEKAFWHPHNYEILSGQLQAPGLPEAAETAFLRDKMNSYGKTWHLWDTGAPGRAGSVLPMGDPMLGWSFNHDGEVAPALLDDYERRQRTTLADEQRKRVELKSLARPQQGEDALQGRFGGQAGSPP